MSVGCKPTEQLSNWNSIFTPWGSVGPGHGSPTLAGLGRSRVSLTDPESDPVFVIFACILLLPLGREYAILESVGFCVLCNFTSPCLLAQILVICYFLVVYHSASARKFHLLGCSVYSCLFMPHTQWPGQVTGSKVMGQVGSRVKGPDPVPCLPWGKPKTWVSEWVGFKVPINTL